MFEYNPNFHIISLINFLIILLIFRHYYLVELYHRYTLILTTYFIFTATIYQLAVVLLELRLMTTVTSNMCSGPVLLASCLLGTLIYTQLCVSPGPYLQVNSRLQLRRAGYLVEYLARLSSVTQLLSHWSCSCSRTCYYIYDIRRCL